MKEQVDNNTNPVNRSLKTSSDINLTADLEKIVYPKYWFLLVFVFLLFVLSVINFWLYQSFIDKQESKVTEIVEEVVEDFSINLMAIETALLKLSKDYVYSQLQDKSSEDILSLLKQKTDNNWDNWPAIYSIKIVDFPKSEDVGGYKKLVFEDSKLFLAILTKLENQQGALQKGLKLYINLDSVCKDYFIASKTPVMLDFQFRLYHDLGLYKHRFINGNQVIENIDGDLDNSEKTNKPWDKDYLRQVTIKNILGNQDWQVSGYLKFSIIQDFIWFLVKVSAFVILSILVIIIFIYKKLYYLEWQRLNITKDKKHFQQRAEITLASINDGVIITNSTEQVVYINHVIESYLHKKLVDVYFTNITELIPELSVIKNTSSDHLKFDNLDISFGDSLYYFDVQLVKLFDDSNNYLGSSFFLHDLTEQKKAQKRINYLAYHDESTLLPNKLALLDFYKNSVINDPLFNNTNKDDDKVFTIVVNIPSLKNVNDTIGYEHGDATIMKFLSALKSYLDEHLLQDHLYRINPDTFVLVGLYSREKHGKSSPLFITNVITSLKEILSKPIKVNEQEIFLHFYWGVSIYPDNFISKETKEVQLVEPGFLLRYAEIAMSAARRKGFDYYVFYSDDINISLQEKFLLENQLKSAIANNKLELLFQPQQELKTRLLKGFEILVRWQKDDGSMVLPATFIPLLEKSGLIVTVGDWILKEACRLGNELIAQGVQFDTIAVNVSGLQLQSEHFVSRLEKILTDTDFKFSKLEIEITETVLLENPEKIIAVLAKIRSLGVKTALDDFGTGFSSLSYLKQLPIDYLKIDKIFVNEIDSGDTRLLNAILAIAKTLNLITIAEGVETAEQVSFLRQHLCDIIQGYYINRPLSFDDVIKAYT